MKRILQIAIHGSLAMTLACGGWSGDGDSKNDSFGGSQAKADGKYSECQLAEVLKFVNESETTRSKLRGLDIRPEAVDGIVEHRNGPDGDLGTGDDDIYDSLEELDAVDFVGPVTLDRLVAPILERCEIDLETRPFITADTFAGTTGGGFTRDEVELEATMTVTGTTGAMLREILTDTDGDGDSNFQKIARVRLMEAFSYGFDVDEMPWNRSSHRLRESLPFIPLTIEFGRYEPDEDDGRRELSLGTDVMDDTYYDSFDYRLLGAKNLLRGRVRWDNAESVRRLLIAAKFNSGVDDNGIKRAAKIDVRTEGGTHKDDLDNDVRRGQVEWTGRVTPIEPIRELYQRLMEEGGLPNIGNHDDVLILDPKIHLRSTRRRYHLDLVSSSEMRSFYAHGKDRIADIRDQLQAALDSGSLTAAAASEAQSLIDEANVLIDDSKVDALAKAELGNFAAFELPNELASTATSQKRLDNNRFVADTVSELFHSFGDRTLAVVDDVSGTDGDGDDDFMEAFVTWRKSLDSGVSLHRTHRAFAEAFERLDEDRSAELANFADFIAARAADGDDDFEDLGAPTEAIWVELGRQLHREDLQEAARQIEAAGSMARALWFDQARAFHVPASSRPFGNFMIDTMD
ncbi:MAG: hypothetical protein KJO07_08025, partial [Deltaproteobacteria bacterium]|nr:hypothetical protein [Deltaproteobacteria bacterium]